MRTVGSLALVLLTCGACFAQTGSSGSVGNVAGVSINFESKLEPPSPRFAGRGESGVKKLGKNKTEGMRRYATNTLTHEYFGYDARVEPVKDGSGTYRITFSALTLTPEEMGLSDPENWRLLPAPIFPEPQVVRPGDTIALDIFENSGTGQKIVDYIHLQRTSCDAESAGAAQLACLSLAVQQARRSLQDTLARVQSNREPAAAGSMKASEQAWEKYSEDACSNMGTETKRLQCELKLTLNYTNNLWQIY